MYDHYPRYERCFHRSIPPAKLCVTPPQPESPEDFIRQMIRIPEEMRLEVLGRMLPQEVDRLRRCMMEKKIDVRIFQKTKPWSLAYSPDGTSIALGSWDGRVRVWDTNTGQEMPYSPLIGNGTIESVAFSPDGTRIASGSYRTVRVWDAVTGDEMSFSPITGGSTVLSVAFSPDGTRIASGSLDNTVRVWNAKTGDEMSFFPLTGHTSGVSSVAFSLDGTSIASGSWDRTVRVWDTNTGQEMPYSPLIGHTGMIESVAFSPDGTRIASASMDKMVRVWDAKTGNEMSFSPLTGHTSSAISVAFSPDGTRIASGSADRTVRVWNAKTGNEMTFSPLTGHTSLVTSVAFSPDGTRIASMSSADNTVRVWRNIGFDKVLRDLSSKKYELQSRQLLLLILGHYFLLAEERRLTLEDLEQQWKKRFSKHGLFETVKDPNGNETVQPTDLNWFLSFTQAYKELPSGLKDIFDTCWIPEKKPLPWWHQWLPWNWRSE